MRKFCRLLFGSYRIKAEQRGNIRSVVLSPFSPRIHGYRLGSIYRVSKKTWTFFEIGIIPLFIKESFQNFIW